MMKWEAFFNELEGQVRKGLPFAAYRKPSGKSENPAPTWAILQKEKGSHKTTDFTESGFVFAPFNSEAPALLIPEESAEVIETLYPEQWPKHRSLKKEKLNFPPSQLETDVRIHHENLVQQAIDQIRAGRFRKVVLSRKEKIETQLDAVTIFKALLKKYSGAFVYLWFHPESGFWLGATPEGLLEMERNRFHTMALAGTQSFKGTLQVQWGVKELEEQRMVSDYLLKNLQELTERPVEHSGPHTIKAGSLLHLRTDIQGFLRKGSTGLVGLLDILHPTPAVCGLPKEAARNFILENEGYNREYYTGFLGEINLSTRQNRSSNSRNQEHQAYGSVVRRSSLFVNLRCLKLKEGQARLYVGGGITADSNPSLEWEETENKSHTMKSVLAK